MVILRCALIVLGFLIVVPLFMLVIDFYVAVNDGRTIWLKSGKDR